MKKFLREPLFHFLVLGAALFAIWFWKKDAAGGDSGRIVVTQARIRQLAIGFTRTRQRPATDQELTGLVQDFVVEEVCVREAQKMGLDRDDTIIRRRLRQKFEFVTEDAIASASAAPTDATRQKQLDEALRALVARYTVSVEPAPNEGKPGERAAKAP
jgi:hypothetical protein